MAVKVTKKQACSGYLVAPEAVRDARLIGLAGDVAKRLGRMAKRSAPLTHEQGNRRFGDFVLRVQSREVKAVSRI